MIGSRIMSFIKGDPEITIIGVEKYSPDEKVNKIELIPEKTKWDLENRIDDGAYSNKIEQKRNPETYAELIKAVEVEYEENS